MDQRQRKRGVVDSLNSAISTAQNIQRAAKIGRAVTGAAEIASTSEIWVPAAIVIAVILIIVFIILLGGGTGAALELGTQPTPGTSNGGSGNGNISSCQFTRSGVQNSIKSSVLAGWITDAANKAGIPPAVMASIAMHENLGFVTNADNNDSRISMNRFCNEGTVFCESAGQNLHSGPCSGADLAGGARDARAVGFMQVVDVYHPGEDLCSITESLSIAAQKLKDDGITIQPTQDQINTAIRNYYNSCSYGSYNYCGEVWQDYQNCQASNSAASDCPIPNGSVTCGSKNVPVNNCGHCGVDYPRMDLCTYDAIYYAMDIAGNDFDPIYLPKIRGNAIGWTFSNQTFGAEATQQYTGLDQQTGDRYFIGFHHTQTGSGNPGTHLSGDVGARICGGGCNERHTHVELGLVTASGTQWLDAPNYFCKK